MLSFAVGMSVTRWAFIQYGTCRKKDSSTHSHSYNGSHHSRGTLGKPTNRSMNSSGLDSNFTMMEADRVFGRTSEWSTPADLETGAGAGLESQQFLLLTLLCQ